MVVFHRIIVFYHEDKLGSYNEKKKWAVNIKKNTTVIHQKYKIRNIKEKSKSAEAEPY